jgi:Ca-activated chloride channel family protein
MRWTPLTKDLSAIRNATPFLQPDDLPTQFGGTEIGKAVRFSHKTLRDRGPGDSMIVLVSDGDSADLRGLTARQIGAELAQDGIVLYAIHVGDEIPPAALYDLSRPTGGRVFSSDNPQSLVEVFRHVDTMQPVKLQPAAAGLVDGFTPLAIAGLIFGGIYLMTLFGLRYTPW